MSIKAIIEAFAEINKARTVERGDNTKAEGDKPEGIRGIDDVKINDAAESVRNFFDTAGSVVDEIADRGLVITPTIFGLKIPFEIRIGADE